MVQMLTTLFKSHRKAQVLSWGVLGPKISLKDIPCVLVPTKCLIICAHTIKDLREVNCILKVDSGRARPP